MVADSRAPRDGRFIEKIGTYNPITNPATIDLDVNKAAQWLLNGAQPTDTARAILSYKGAAYKKHLQVGVNKGAITQEDADNKFAVWMSEKDAKVEAKKSGLASTAAQIKADAMKAETKRKENIAAKIVAKNTVVEEVAEEVAEPIEEVTETAEVVVEEVTESTEEVADTAEAVAETPETSSEETSSEEATSEETAAE